LKAFSFSSPFFSIKFFVSKAVNGFAFSFAFSFVGSVCIEPKVISKVFFPFFFISFYPLFTMDRDAITEKLLGDLKEKVFSLLLSLFRFPFVSPVI
jgi:hypothetical protein